MNIPTHRLLLGSLLMMLFALPAMAQTHPRNATIAWDTGWKQVTGGAGNKQKISLRIWQEYVQHSDGGYTWSLNYEVEAHNKNAVGNWKWVNQLSHLTYTLTGPSGSQSGTLQLNNAMTSKGPLYDGVLMAGVSVGPPVVGTATVTAVRFGGSSGITVSWTH